jgi:hypothetical protein
MQWPGIRGVNEKKRLDVKRKELYPREDVGERRGVNKTRVIHPLLKKITNNFFFKKKNLLLPSPPQIQEKRSSSLPLN